MASSLCSEQMETRLSSLVLTVVLGICRIPANMRMKSNLLLHHANIHKSSQLPRDVRHGEEPLSRRVHQSPNPSPQTALRRTAGAPSSRPYQNNTPGRPWSANPPEHVAESSRLCRDNLNTAQLLC